MIGLGFEPRGQGSGVVERRTLRPTQAKVVCVHVWWRGSYVDMCVIVAYGCAWRPRGLRFRCSAHARRRSNAEGHGRLHGHGAW